MINENNLLAQHDAMSDIFVAPLGRIAGLRSMLTGLSVVTQTYTLDKDHNREALRRAIVGQFDQYVKLNKKIPPEILTSLSGIDDAGRLADTIAAHLPLKLEQKQKILEMSLVIERLEHLLRRLHLSGGGVRDDHDVALLLQLHGLLLW